MNTSMPGLGSPREWSMPLGVSATRGVARPARGPSWIDFVTTPPIAVRSLNAASSLPAAAQPDAVNTGSGTTRRPSSAVMSTSPENSVPPAGRMTTSLIGVSPTRHSRGSNSHGCGAEGVGRHGAERIPADTVAAEHRSLGARTHHAGLPLVIDDGEHAGHAPSDAACHRLLDRELGGDAGTAV